jgi:fatty acid elongase 3
VCGSQSADRGSPSYAEFKALFMLHNFLLSAGSGLVLALMLEEVR